MYDFRGQSVLIVEDDDDLAAILRFLFERYGLAVERIADGRAAMERLASPAPHLVLLDIMLPYIDGMELIQRLRDSPGWSAVPLVVLSARAREADIVRALELGADDYVLKPFQPDEVVARLRRLLRKGGGA